MGARSPNIAQPLPACQVTPRTLYSEKSACKIRARRGLGTLYAKRERQKKTYAQSMPTRPLAQILHSINFVMPVTPENLTKESRPCGRLLFIQFITCSTKDNDPAILKSDGCSLALGKTEQRNRKANKRIHISNLLHLVGTGVSNLGSRATTGTRFIVTKQVGTNTKQGRLSFRLTGQKVASAVKGCRRNLRTWSIMKAGDSRDAFCEGEKGNLLRSHANLANGSVLGVHI
jgi:hypothetical protein